MCRQTCIAVSFLGLAAWMALTVYGFACYFAPSASNEPDPLPDLVRIVWLALSFWLGIILAIGLSVMARKQNKLWRVATIAPAFVSLGIILVAYMTSGR